MILTFRMTMEHVIACVTEQIFNALLAFYDRTDRSAQFTFQAHFGGISLHDVFDRFRVAVLLS